MRQPGPRGLGSPIWNLIDDRQLPAIVIWSHRAHAVTYARDCGNVGRVVVVAGETAVDNGDDIRWCDFASDIRIRRRARCVLGERITRRPRYPAHFG